MESKVCVLSIARQDARSFSVLILSMVLLLLSGPILVKGQGPVYLFGDNLALPCVSTTQSDSEVFTWNDQTEATVPIYSVNGPGVTEQTVPAMNIDKYGNFDITNNYPNNVSLLINLLEVNDAGTYICNFIGQTVSFQQTVDVEAIPISVEISCARSSPADNCPSPSSSTSNSFSCNCIAIGAYPGDLQFGWSNGATGVQQSQMNSTERAGAVDFYTDAVIAPTEDPGSVTCTLNEYKGNWEGDRNATYNFNPPMCVLQTTCIKTGNVVSLTCTCTGASPAEGLVYSFYRDGEILSSDGTNVLEAAIEVDQEYIFSCRGCNGLNYGNSSNDTQLVMCQRSTTALPTTTITTVPLSTKEPTSTKAMVTTTEEPKDDNPKNPGRSSALGAGGIAGIIVGVVAVIIVIVVIAVIVCKKGEDDSKPSDDKLDDNGAGPRGDPEIPAYGVVDKNRTKDPTPAPRSSMRDSKNPSNPKQDGPMEMQYADLDHGNKPPSDEVRKPKEEPTEYATVQSVIV